MIWVLIYSIIIIIMSVLAYFIMKNRKAEVVGKPFVIRSFYHIILISIVLHIGVLACYTENSLVTFITMTFASYMVIDTITNRGLKKWKSSLCRYGVIIGTAMIIIVVLNKTNCFGATYRVAHASEVKSITLKYRGLFGDNYDKQVRINSKDMIQKILSVQEDIISDYKMGQESDRLKSLFDWEICDNSSCEVDESMQISRTIQMEVQMNHGFGYQRKYQIAYPEILKLIKVELSDDSIHGEIKKLKEDTTYLTIKDIYDWGQKSITMNHADESSKLINEFFDCLEKDLLDTTEEEYLRPREATRYIADVFDCEIILLDSYKRTMDFLSRYHAFPELTDKDYQAIADTKGLTIYEYQDGLNETNYCTECYRGSYINSYQINKLNEDLIQLLKLAQVQYASKISCYKIGVNGKDYIIPAEYSDYVKRVIAEGEKSSNLINTTYD